MKVFINPLEPKGSRPWVRFTAGNGWQVFDTLTKGANLPDLAEAANDYNSHVQRAIGRLNLGEISVAIPTEDVNTLPGWGDAVRAEMVSRHARNVPTMEPRKAFPIPEGCGCDNCNEIHAKAEEQARLEKLAKDEAAKAHEAGKKAFEHAKGAGKTPFGLMGLLAAAAALGALDGILEDAPDIIDEETNPQIIKLLREAGIMREIPGPIPGTVAGIVAIPRSFGEQFASDVEDAIRNGNPTALLVLLSGAGLVP